MTAIVILNVVFAVFVVGGILMLLGYGIAKDRAMAGTLSLRRFHRAAPARVASSRPVRVRDAMDVSSAL